MGISGVIVGKMGRGSTHEGDGEGARGNQVWLLWEGVKTEGESSHVRLP